MVLGDSQPRPVKMEAIALHLGLHFGETQDLESRRLTPRDGTCQRLGLEGNPLPNSNIGPVHRRPKKRAAYHRRRLSGGAYHPVSAAA